jgi:hypothetical protein
MQMNTMADPGDSCCRIDYMQDAEKQQVATKPVSRQGLFKQAKGGS